MGDKLASLAVYIGAASIMIVLNASIIKEIFGGIGMVLSAVKSAVNAIPNAIHGASQLKNDINNLRGTAGSSGGRGGKAIGAAGADGAAGAGGNAAASAAAVGGAAKDAARAVGSTASKLNQSFVSPSTNGEIAGGIARGKGLAIPAAAPSMGKSGTGGLPSYTNTKGLKSPHTFSNNAKVDGKKLNDIVNKNPALKSLNPEKMISQSNTQNKSEINKLAQNASKEAYNDSIERGQSKQLAEKRAQSVEQGVQRYGNEIAKAYKNELGPDSNEKVMMSKYNQLNDINAESVGKLDAGERAAYAENTARQIQSQTRDNVYKQEFDSQALHYREANHGKLSSSNRHAAEESANRIADAAGLKAYNESLPVANNLVEKSYARFEAGQKYSQNEQLIAQRRSDYTDARNAFSANQRDYERLTTVQPGAFRGGDTFNVQTQRKDGSGDSVFPSQNEWKSFVRENVDRFGQFSEREVDTIAGRAKFNFENSVSMYQRETNGSRNILHNIPGNNDTQRMGNLMTGFISMESLAVVPEIKAKSVMMNVAPDYRDGANLTLGYNNGKGSNSSVFDIGVEIHNESVARPNATIKQISDSVAARRVSSQLNKTFPFQ